MERKLTAILCGDVFGYSRLMGEDEEATHHTLISHRRLIDSLIEQHHGRFVNSAGDSVLAEFASVVNAIQCAVEVQSALKVENASLAPDRQMQFRIGVNLGDVIVDGEQIYGDGVNVAARLESLAEPGGICISNTVHDQVSSKLALSYADLGDQAVKNIAKPVRVFRVLLDGAVAPRGTRPTPRRYWRGGVLSLTGLAIIVGTIVLVQNLTLKSPHTHASIPPQEKPGPPLPSIPSIAVLPFANLSGDPNQEYFSDGITDQIITEISRLPGLFVIDRNSSSTYKNNAAKAQEIGRELGVKYLLEGSAQKSADQVRIGVELVDANSGTQIWAQRFDRPLENIFAVQDEIVKKAVTTLALIFKLDERKIPFSRSSTTDNLEAFDDLLRGYEYLWRFTKDDNAKARQWAEKAIERDPNFADAYALLAASYRTRVLFRWSENPGLDLERSSEFAQKALALDDSNSLALAILCGVDSMQRKFDRAVTEGERAVAINPNYALGYQILAEAFVVSNRYEAAILAAEKAAQLDPSNRDFYEYFVGQSYVDVGRYREAIPLLKKSIAAYPNMPWPHVALIAAYTELGRGQDARAEAIEFMRISPGFAMGHPNMDESVNRRLEADLRQAGVK